ncbi:hypothetical protein LSH36_487g01019 [Paralvinella palmiformis]|uniref:C-type lectin domain-containing protein n=1 Tax=Paralvinella palmiformis TaxID=53620 RepID=A0AAD9MX38_9ANNE|nr:hypothetical protein LSH36_487g01019 [Paralvinella palmiformis]
MKYAFALSLVVRCWAYSISGCPELWYEYDGSCYNLSSETRSYWVARLICRAESGDLVIISGESENDFIKELFLIYHRNTGKNISAAFIGLDDIDEESVFVWVDGSPLAYRNWAAGGPDNYGDSDVCTMLGPNNAHFGMWDDISITRQRRFVCEFRMRTTKVGAATAVASIKPALYLESRVIEVIYARSIVECLQGCIQRRVCLSINFMPGDQSNAGVCRLMTATAGDYYAVRKTVDGWMYLELLN